MRVLGARSTDGVLVVEINGVEYAALTIDQQKSIAVTRVERDGLREKVATLETLLASKDKEIQLQAAHIAQLNTAFNNVVKLATHKPSKFQRVLEHPAIRIIGLALPTVILIGYSLSLYVMTYGSMTP